MSDEEPVFTFFLAWFGFTMVLFPLVATFDSTVFDGRLGQWMIPISLVVAIPAALEFAFSGRDTTKVALFVGTFLGLFFLAILLQAIVFVSMGAEEPLPVVEFLFLFAAYLGSYVLVYRVGLGRVKRTITG